MKNQFVLLIMLLVFKGVSISQWQPDVRLTNAQFASFTSSNWCIAASGNVVHVIWEDFRDVNEEIYYKRSIDGGSSWGTDIRLTNNAGDSNDPSVAVSDSVVHVVWFDNRDGNHEIYYKRSTDGGISWGADTRLTSNSFSSLYPSVTVSGSVVQVIWQDNRDGNDEIYYKRSTNGGASWGADTRLTSNSANSNEPSISVSGLVVHVVWQDNRDGNDEIYYKRSTDGGASWGTDTRLINYINVSGTPSVWVSGLVVHVVWQDYGDGNWEIYYKRSTDGGTSWEAHIRLSNNSFASLYPSVSASDSVVHVIWQDFRDGNFEIYCKRSTNGGVSWEADTRLTNNTANSEFASVSASGQVVHAVWQDNRDGNFEIYYKRDPTGNLLPPLAPSTLIASAISSSRINLNWTDNSINETGFKIERSTNAGTNWILKDSVSQNTMNYSDSGLTANMIYHYRIYAYNAAANSPYSNIAFDTTFSPVGVILNSDIPMEYSLSQNYPNPFNPVTVVKYQIPKAAYVSIMLYDQLGRETTVLHAGNQQAGYYQVTVDGRNLASGVYFCRITTEGFNKVIKMLMVK